MENHHHPHHRIDASRIQESFQIAPAAVSHCAMDVRPTHIITISMEKGLRCALSMLALRDKLRPGKVAKLNIIWKSESPGTASKATLCWFYVICMAHISWISSFANSALNLTKQRKLVKVAVILHHGLTISLLPFKLAKPEIAWIEVSSSARSKVERVWCWSWILLSTAASLKGPSKAQQSNLESHLEIGVFKNSFMESGIPQYPINFVKVYIYKINYKPAYDSWFTVFGLSIRAAALIYTRNDNVNATHSKILYIPGIYRS